jgi:serine phosphatase RsbU (regulator of sigma subunit)
MPTLGLVGINGAFQTEAPPNFDLCRWTFPAGACCVLVSDGVLEAGVEFDDPFGTDRLLRAVNQAKNGAETAWQIGQSVFRHTGGRGSHDDATVVVVSRTV